MIADCARSFRSPGFGPVDGKTVPATAGLLSVSVPHTLNAITAQRVVDMRGAVQIGRPRLPQRFEGAPPARGKRAERKTKSEERRADPPFTKTVKGRPPKIASAL